MQLQACLTQRRDEAVAEGPLEGILPPPPPKPKAGPRFELLKTILSNLFMHLLHLCHSFPPQGHPKWLKTFSPSPLY